MHPQYRGLTLMCERCSHSWIHRLGISGDPDAVFLCVACFVFQGTSIAASHGTPVLSNESIFETSVYLLDSHLSLVRHLSSHYVDLACCSINTNNSNVGSRTSRSDPMVFSGST